MRFTYPPFYDESRVKVFRGSILIGFVSGVVGVKGGVLLDADNTGVHCPVGVEARCSP